MENSFFGSNLKQYLKDNGILQTWLAENIGMTDAGLSHLLTGTSQPSFLSLLKILNFLEVPLEFILNYSKKHKCEKCGK